MQSACTGPKAIIMCKKYRSIISRITDLVWNNSKKLSARSDKYSACVNSAATLSHKQMRVKRVCCRRMIQRKREEDMVRWSVPEDEHEWWCINVYMHMTLDYGVFFSVGIREMKANFILLIYFEGRIGSEGRE